MTRPALRLRKGEVSHRFGGDWTTRKLDVLAKYLTGYTTALKNAPFDKWYVDAFAGTGYRDARPAEKLDTATDWLLLPDLADQEPQSLLDGSARRALTTAPAFDRYVFIEQSAARCANLESLGAEFPSLSAAIEVRHGDANPELQALCAEDWRARRAVLFLDPYGMQVEWATIEAIARTKAIDMWLLFPLGIGVNRLLKKSGDIPDSWRRRLDLLLGTQDWYDEVYEVESTPTLFGADEERVVKASTATIGRYFNERLGSIFAGVAAEPGVLRNSKSSPLYLLCFAVGNPRGTDVALRIANHLLKAVR